MHSPMRRRIGRFIDRLVEERQDLGQSFVEDDAPDRGLEFFTLGGADFNLGPQVDQADVEVAFDLLKIAKTLALPLETRPDSSQVVSSRRPCPGWV